jgi:hypothetical protein
LKKLRLDQAKIVGPARELAAETRRLEHQLSDVINDAYGLTPDEVALMWRTAPPRMPISPPSQPVA